MTEDHKTIRDSILNLCSLFNEHYKIPLTVTCSFGVTKFSIRVKTGSPEVELTLLAKLTDLLVTIGIPHFERGMSVVFNSEDVKVLNKILN
ncbi:hypothetical protein Molly5_39 [Maribacter phage Molly_5]|uniref:Uncharacterized protein n=1 Tax=Maribacter phage Molly_1 TaxID=2745685 RepID=A0A8E4UYE9_9CAUD|nr:hypothetical protein M1M29_gp039 [Maribacter phage Molly_1]QQO97721.1 hypothetical protein Molly2_39 [Maribacter phage Molly_2]QQO97921.1 hypothetical protein Molly3_39 [Maribacter phage Molly_3]QQO98121.1 hypothetical protein Molly4_39 [Maribacter phage Molly_4]QQO98321.1 hypothetical protein Molly5_39 [Maribacter phage Molly_5]QQO97521.1 hypothetical protein Molly1_39 [Maribacter phage Molly_1]